MFSKYLNGSTVETNRFNPETGNVDHIIDDYDNNDDARDALVARNLDPLTVDTCIYGHDI